MLMGVELKGQHHLVPLKFKQMQIFHYRIFNFNWHSVDSTFAYDLSFMCGYLNIAITSYIEKD